MIRKEFNKAKNEIDNARELLEKILDTLPDFDEEENAIENEKAYFVIENIKNNMEMAVDKLKYYNADTKEGTLQMDPETEKFYIEYNDGTESNKLSCGHSIELYTKDIYDGRYKWYFGRVEGRTKPNTSSWQNEYYFYGNDEQPALCVGMKVRKRQL